MLVSADDWPVVGDDGDDDDGDAVAQKDSLLCSDSVLSVSSSSLFCASHFHGT